MKNRFLLFQYSILFKRCVQLFIIQATIFSAVYFVFQNIPNSQICQIHIKNTATKVKTERTIEHFLLTNFTIINCGLMVVASKHSSTDKCLTHIITDAFFDRKANDVICLKINLTSKVYHFFVNKLLHKEHFLLLKFCTCLFVKFQV